MVTTAEMTMESESATPAPALSLTQAAEEKLRQLLSERNIAAYGLRVFVSGSGCSGLQYGMAFEPRARDFDTVIDQAGVRLFVDPTSLEYLAGASIDFVDTVTGGGFKIDNPNAVSGCGCGHSSQSGEGCGSGCGCH